MPQPGRPHLLGIDDGPFEKQRDRETPLVAVMMEGPDLVEGVAIRSFPIDGAGVTQFLGDWIGELRFRPALQGIVLGGITMAGLAVLDAPLLARRLGLPVLVVNRKQPSDQAVSEALRAAGLDERIDLLKAAPPSVPAGDGLWVSFAGAEQEAALALVRASLGKSALPEPLRVAHLVAAALVRGASRGRV